MRGLLLLCVLVAGCATPARTAPSWPDALVIAFADGFHSGIVLERSAVPPGLLPAEATAPWVVVHYGERRWIRGEADGLFDAMRLGLSWGDGGVQIDAVDWWVHGRGGAIPRDIRVWAFPVSQAELDGLRARLDSWVDPRGLRQPIRPGSCWWPARRHWSLRSNCHDFTADLLAGAGILVDRPPIMTAGPLRASLDRAWSRRDPGP